MNERQRAQLGFGESSRPSTATAATATVQPVYNARRNLYANFMRISTHAKTTHTNNEYKKKNKKTGAKKRGQKQLNKTRSQN